MNSFTTDQWVILGLVFVLGLLVGAWMTSGGRRKWKTRYNQEMSERKALEERHREREAHWAAQEKDWREQDSRREAALRSHERREPFVEDRVRDRHPGDADGDGVPNRADARPLDRDRR